MSLHADPLTANLKQILTSSVRNNAALGVTGGLIFNRDYFAQVLEGELAAVTQTYARISADHRHSQSILIEMKTVSKRLFGAWSMGYAANTELLKSLCAEYGYEQGFDPKKMSGSDLIAFIHALVTNEERFASSQKLAS